MNDVGDPGESSAHGFCSYCQVSELYESFSPNETRLFGWWEIESKMLVILQPVTRPMLACVISLGVVHVNIFAADCAATLFGFHPIFATNIHVDQDQFLSICIPTRLVNPQPVSLGCPFASLFQLPREGWGAATHKKYGTKDMWMFALATRLLRLK